ncbi:hypothetical protein [Phaffia rhodozyma]|uniref:Uncharacterized protein n=1 Tax=Phaffia rhodozyma TaxID=264483 RepID=A0A0F7SSS4_PHARH|nr:hypothetical protein [Phaffia rhodozyma]
MPPHMLCSSPRDLSPIHHFGNPFGSTHTSLHKQRANLEVKKPMSLGRISPLCSRLASTSQTSLIRRSQVIRLYSTPCSSSSSSSSSVGEATPTGKKPRKASWSRTRHAERDYRALGLPPSKIESYERVLKKPKAVQFAVDPTRESVGPERKQRKSAKAIRKERLRGQEVEVRDYLKEKEKEERTKRLNTLEDTSFARRRNGWCWEWFQEGKDLGDIGNMVSTLPDYERETPYPAHKVCEWILAHLSLPPRSDPSSPTEPGRESIQEPTDSFHLLTPESWARLSAPHAFYSSQSYPDLINSRINRIRSTDSHIYDLLYSRGWRGEGLGEPLGASDGIESKDVVDSVRTKDEVGLGIRGIDRVPIPMNVLRKFIDRADQDKLTFEDEIARRRDESAVEPETSRIIRVLDALRRKEFKDEAMRQKKERSSIE